MSNKSNLAILDSYIDSYSDNDDPFVDFPKIKVNNSANATVYPENKQEIEISSRNRSGVVIGVPQPMKAEDGKLDQSRLTPIYMGAVDRSALAEMIVRRMDQLGWSIRTAVGETGLSKSTIQRLRSGESSIETYLEDAEKFGLSVRIALFDANEP